ncbi:MAG: single-stranded DNA-binding protein [Bacilli bacterium]|nr:single-stranded DNA-binding protein [Bacilli bacterium]MBQ3415288.1 single-stranded DNA-binding protein [Clostridia bacterium]MBQ6631556.1 single-stranded DNA-binding protein [Romboutsia sp.]MBR0058192.1 single-stranded DNA-binding protein [Methanobrevibacter sp.]MBQ4584555.1 single-stranded DNA-binding protein [Bacilli bacterium]
MNKVHLIGRLVDNPVLRYTTNKTPVASYTIAINSGYGEKQETDYINTTTWGKSGEFVNKYFVKGQPIAVIGRLKNKNYESNGVKHYGMEVVTEEIEFVGTKKEDTKIETKIEDEEEFTPSFELGDDELPF